MNRFDVIGFFNEIEKKYKVNDWKIKDMHIYPIVRLSVGVKMIKTINNPDYKSFNSKINWKYRVEYYRNRFMSFFYKHKILRIKKADALFVGSSNHEINYNNGRYNRFFEPIIENPLFKKQNSVYIRYGSILNLQRYNSNTKFAKVYNMPQILFNNIKIDKELIKNMLNQLYGWQDTIEKISNFFNLERVKIENDLINAITDSIILKEKYLSILKRLKPKTIYVLCFYGNGIMPLICAAKKLKIKTVDIQHGGQGSGHIAYSLWNALPLEGYSVLPDIFWCWDSESANDINNKFFVNSTTHKALVGGNPWIEKWKSMSKQQHLNLGNVKILYSLQPLPLNTLFSEFIVKIIKITKQYKWVLRLHPRQLDDEEKIRQHLKKVQINDFVEIENAKLYGLPQSLSDTSLHLTFFSGTLIDAFLMGVPTLILDAKYKSLFNNYANSNIVDAVENEDSLYDKIQRMIKLPKFKNYTMHLEYGIQQTILN